MADIQSYPTLIGHIDLPLRLYRLEQGVGSPSGVPLSANESIQSFFTGIPSGHTDLIRAKVGGIAGCFCAMYIPAPECRVERCIGDETADLSEDAWYLRYIEPSLDFSYAQRVGLTMMARLLRLEAISQGQVKIPHSVAELESCLRDGVFAAIVHMEGAEPIDPDLDALYVFYQAGLRSLGPVWSRQNVFASGVPFAFNHTPDSGPGLTDAGKALVQACNELGILIDLSHLNEKGFWDVARLSIAPLVATHSNAHALTPTTRNLTDKQLDAIRESDGLVGVNFNVKDVRSDWQSCADTPLTVVIRHIDYLVERVGIDRVALGTDYDGAMMPTDLSDVSKVPNLYAALAERGYDNVSLQKIAYANWLRIFRQTWH